ncbi:MAG: YfhO family protein, partial [Chloroflexi bacterium]|nr:YfhO family protein [Chloroflexota bacterium]
LVAAISTYALARLLGTGALGATISGLTLAFGSFFVGHIDHDNIVRGAAWTPLVLVLFELAYRRATPRRALYLLGAGVVLGVQMLGVHVQPVLLSLLLYQAYVLVAPLHTPSLGHVGTWRSWHQWERVRVALSPRKAALFLLRRQLGLLLVILVGVGLAAVQLLPLFALGERSPRAGGVSYEFSTSYSVPPTQLVQLLFPYLFRADQTLYWGLWSPAETTVYVGVAPLLLALVALAYVRTRAVLFFGILAGASLLLAMGDYLPLQVYRLVWALPGFSFLRVPARFSFIFVICVAVLAGFGAAWLDRRRFSPRKRFASPRLRRLVLLTAAFFAGAVALSALVLGILAALAANPDLSRSLIDGTYLSLRRADFSLNAGTVMTGMRESLSLSNPRTLGALLLMVAVPALLLLRGMHRCYCALWRVVVVGVVMVDLGMFAQGFYPHRRLASLTPDSAAVQALKAQPGLFRVFVEPELFQDYGPNRLVTDDIQVASGYSSLEPRDMNEFWMSLVRQDNFLMDLFNVRYLLAPAKATGLSRFRGTQYHPVDRLMRGSVNNPSGLEQFRVEPTYTKQVTLIGSIDNPGTREYGVPVAELILHGEQGHLAILPIRFAIETDDGTEPRLGPWPMDGARNPPVVWSGPVLQGRPGQMSVLYGATIPLPQPMVVSQVSIRRVGMSGLLNIHGLGLGGEEGVPVRSLLSRDRAQYQPIYQDQNVEVLENVRALPRAYFVDQAHRARSGSGDGSLVTQLLQDPYDAERMVLLEGGGATDRAPVQQPSSEPAGAAVVRDYQTERVTLDVLARRPGYAVLADRYEAGWRAWVDGREQPILRANAVLRAVAVDPGAHQIVMVYQPPELRYGLLITLGSALSVLLGAAWTVWRGARGLRSGLSPSPR